jgi:hypothetical protein
MKQRDHLQEARRWMKFPATVLIATGILWLLHSYFSLNWSDIGQLTETGIGAVAVFINLVVIPLGSVVAGVGLLLVQRWAMWAACCLPVPPLVVLTMDKVDRIAVKLKEFRGSGEVSSFGDGIMTAILLLALWAVYFLILGYLLKAWREMEVAREWLKLPSRQDRGFAASSKQPPDPASAEDEPDAEDVCLLMPDSIDDESRG